MKARCHLKHLVIQTWPFNVCNHCLWLEEEEE